MDWKALVVGLLLGTLLLLSMGAQRGSVAEQSSGGRYELHIAKDSKGKDVWTIFDTAEGEAKVFVDDTVRRISFTENRVEELK